MASKQFIDTNEIIKLAKNEVIIKTYEGFDIIEPSGKGFFLITNYRFVYYATNANKMANSKSVLEWDLHDISGISAEYGKRVNKFQQTLASSLMGIALAGIAFFLIRLLSKNGQDNLVLFTSISAFVLGFLFFLFRKRKMFYIEIFSKYPKESLISFTSTAFKSSTLDTIKTHPNKFTTLLVQELGTVILEAKQYKNKADI